LAHLPERMFTLLLASRWEISCVAYLEKVHSSSSCPVACLNGTRLE
jgi:hypothetical protein